MSSEARGVVEGLGDAVDEVTVKAVDASNEGRWRAWPSCRWGAH